MYKKVENWIDLPKLEKGILKFWKDNKSFQKLREINKGKKPWSFLDGPITANNPMGVHHAWGRALKDAFQRYWAMNRRELRYQNGFDCQGLWVEVEVEKELGFKTKKDIEKYGIDKFVKQCKARVDKYSKVQTEQTVRLGNWMDWDDSYFTMSDTNNYAIWGFLKKCHERGLVYRGNDVMPWCPRCGTGISQHEMTEGYKDIKSPSIFLRFPIVGVEKESLLVWTTTPWTLTSNVAAAVHPELDYVKVEQNGEKLILSKKLAERVLKPGGKFKVVEEMKGAKLVGLEYSGPFDELGVIVAAMARSGTEGRHELTHVVLSWDEVSEEEGTGIVHIAPGCGREDYELGKEHNLWPIAPIDESGVFVEGFDGLTGRKAQDVSGDIIGNLKKKGALYHAAEYSHSYPHCWRCGTELLFRLVDEWFIKMDPWREEIMAVAKKVKWIPPYGKELELDWLKNMRDWMISKKRYWGLALPIWACAKCNEFQVVGGKEELKEKAIKGWDKFEGNSPHRPWIDEVVIKCDKCGGEARRIPDVGNPWLDAGIVAYSTVKYSEDKEYWKKWIPADLILESFPGQFRNWFYALLAMSTMMENINPMKNLVGYALMRDEKGEEMHKSKGNAVSFDEAADKVGVDVLRWSFCAHEMTQNLNFGYNLAKEVRGRFFNTLWNCYAFYANYARLNDFKPPAKPTPMVKRTDFDRWIISKLQLTLAEAKKGMEEYNTRRVCNGLAVFFRDLSNWYIRHCRRRFWRVEDEKDSEIAQETLYECLHAVTRVLAPLMPFTAEEIYQNIVRGWDEKAPESVHHTEYPGADMKLVDKKLYDDMECVVRLTSLALSARERSKIKVRQPLSRLLVCPADKGGVAAVQRFNELLQADLNVKAVEIKQPGSANELEWQVKPDFKALGEKFGEKKKQVIEYVKRNGEKLVEARRKGAISIDIKIDGEQLTLDEEALIFESASPEGWYIVEDKSGWVALDLAISEELALEGMMRDLLRKLQVQRKEIGLEIEDRVKIVYETKDSKLLQAVEKFGDYLKAELLCLEMKRGTPSDKAGIIKVAGAEIRVDITKA